jgi:hypothetical protein
MNNDDRLIAPNDRAQLLDIQIRTMELKGYVVQARPTRHLVIMTRGRRRTQIFINEFGEASFPP